MVKLVAQTPCHGLLPVQHGGLTLSEVSFDALFSYAPFAGKERGASEALKTHHGVALPRVGRMVSADDVSAIWFAQGQALVMGAQPDPGLARFGAVSDQSDAWAVVDIEGARVIDVLSRLVPVDVGAMKNAQTVRSLIQHMTGSLTRISKDRFRVMVMRSMARTLVHDLDVAIKSVAARQEYS